MGGVSGGLGVAGVAVVRGRWAVRNWQGVSCHLSFLGGLEVKIPILFFPSANH